MSYCQIKVKGYTTPREFSGFQIPITLQSAAIRRYCDERGFVFNHHVAENISSGTYLVLERVIAEANLFQALAMCSVSMLPRDIEHRTQLLESCVKNRLTIHFLFESLIVTTCEDIETVNHLLSLTALLKNDQGRISYIAEFLNSP